MGIPGAHGFSIVSTIDNLYISKSTPHSLLEKTVTFRNYYTVWITYEFSRGSSLDHYLHLPSCIYYITLLEITLHLSLQSPFLACCISALYLACWRAHGASAFLFVLDFSLWNRMISSIHKRDVFLPILGVCSVL